MVMSIDHFIKNNYTIEISSTTTLIVGHHSGMLTGQKTIFEPIRLGYKLSKYNYDNCKREFVCTGSSNLNKKELKEMIHLGCNEDNCYIVNDKEKKITFLFEERGDDKYD